MKDVYDLNTRWAHGVGKQQEKNPEGSSEDKEGGHLTGCPSAGQVEVSSHLSSPEQPQARSRVFLNVLPVAARGDPLQVSAKHLRASAFPSLYSLLFKQALRRSQIPRMSRPPSPPQPLTCAKCPPASDWQAPRQIKSRPLKAKHCRTEAALSWARNSGGCASGLPEESKSFLRNLW